MEIRTSKFGNGEVVHVRCRAQTGRILDVEARELVCDVFLSTQAGGKVRGGSVAVHALGVELEPGGAA